MIDYERLVEFKATTGEDLLIGSLLTEITRALPIDSLLDVGPGTGAVIRAFLAQRPDLHVAAIEPDRSAARRLPSRVDVIRDMVESTRLHGRYDLVLLSHVLGHIPVSCRSYTIRRLYGCLSQVGNLVIVTNALVPGFQDLQAEIWKAVGDSTYEIHLASVLSEVPLDAEVRIGSFTVLCQAGDQAELYRLLSAFAPTPLPELPDQQLCAAMDRLRAQPGYELRIPQLLVSISRGRSPLQLATAPSLSSNREMLAQESHATYWQVATPLGCLSLADHIKGRWRRDS